MPEILESVLNIVFPKEKNTQALEALTAQELRNLLPMAETSDEDLISLFNYRNPVVKQLIKEVKYNHNKQLAFMCAELISEELLDFLYEKKEFQPETNIILLPVPISIKRRKQRGYNQTELVTEMVSKMLPPIEYCPHTLRRDIDKTSQTKKNKNERLENIKNCFSVIDKQKIKDSIVVVFDDVITTGATLDTICQEISKHNPKEIMRVTIAH